MEDCMKHARDTKNGSYDRGERMEGMIK